MNYPNQRPRKVDIWLNNWKKIIKKKIVRLESQFSIKRIKIYKCIDIILEHNDDMHTLHSIVIPGIMFSLESLKTSTKKKLFDRALKHRCMMLVGYRYKQIIKTKIYEILDKENQLPLSICNYQNFDFDFDDNDLLI